MHSYIERELSLPIKTPSLRLELHFNDVSDGGPI